MPVPTSPRRRVFPALGLALALATAGTASPAAEPTARLTVSGEGRVSAAPDMAVVSLGVVTEAPEAAAALAENTRRLTEVMALVAAAGIAPRDVQTSGLSLSPQYDYDTRGPDGRPRITGYQVSNTVTIRVRALERLGGLLDEAVRGGANQLHGLSFALADPAAALTEARRAAARDARARAETYAEALGVRLGPVLSVAEAGGAMPPQPVWRSAAAMEAAAPVPVAGGEVDYAVTITVEFALLP